MFEIYARFPVLLWPVGPVILVWTIWSLYRILHNNQRWPRINGIVREIQLDRTLMRGWGHMYMYVPQIKVTYNVNNHDYHACFQWDAGINFDYAKELLAGFHPQGVISLLYAPFDPSIVRLRFGKLCNEIWYKYIALGSVGLLLTILTFLAFIGNLWISSPVRTIVVTATPLLP